MFKIVCNYVVAERNPDYKYGDLNRPAWIDISGRGHIVYFIQTEEGTYAIVCDTDTRKIHKVGLAGLSDVEVP